MSAAVLLALVVSLQSNSSTLLGRVTDDSTGLPVEGAVVEIFDRSFDVITDSAGKYELNPIPPGAHAVRFTRLGYGTRELRVAIPAGERFRLDVSLRRRPILIPALYATAGVRRDSESKTRILAQNWSDYAGRRIEALDALWYSATGSADYLSALATGPGAFADPDAPTSLRVRGGSSDQTLVRLDGAPVYVPYHWVGAFGAFSPEVVQDAILYATIPPSGIGHALSGFVDVNTISDRSQRLGLQGGLTSRSGRSTLTGPLGEGGWLLSGRHLRSDGWLGGRGSAFATGTDVLAKAFVPAAGGVLEWFTFHAENGLRFPAAIDPGGELQQTGETRVGGLALDPDTEGLANQFAQQGTTASLRWARMLGARWGVRTQFWRATADVTGRWQPSSKSFRLSSRRENRGWAGQVVRTGPEFTAKLGFQVEVQSVSYEVDQGPATGEASPGSGSIFLSSTPFRSTDFFLETTRRLPRSGSVSGGLRMTAGPDGSLRPALRVAVRLKPFERLAAVGGYARTYQYVQSARNPASILDRYFGSDLPIVPRSGTAAPAHADQFMVGLEARPTPQVRLSLRAFRRLLSSLLLVAPRTSEPFATRAAELGLGTGAASGLELSAEIRASRMFGRLDAGLVSNSRTLASIRYQPGYTARRSLSMTLGFRPTSSLLILTDGVVLEGRRTTPIIGPLELDRCGSTSPSCGLAGSPRADGAALSSTGLPAFLKFDLEVRYDFRSASRARKTTLAVFARAGNLFNRPNIVGFVRNSLGESLDPLDSSRSRAFTAGIEWAY